MQYRHNIRFRIFLSYPLLGLLISLIVIIFFAVSFMQLEKQFLSDFLNEELEHFIELTEKKPELSQQKAKSWVAYKVDEDHPVALLEPLQSYHSGIYDIFLEGRMLDVAIAEKKGCRYYLLYDDSEFESLEQSLLTYMIAGAFIIVWAATWYGIWFSKQVIKPVINLANQVRALNTDHPRQALAPDYANDEVGFLAAEFDDYSRRIHELVKREHEFTANASHELRTPLTVIMTATEGMLIRDNLTEDIKRRLRRIERSAEEMKNRLEVLLILARNPEQGDRLADLVELEPLINHIIDDHVALLPASVRVTKKIQGQPVITASYSLLSIALSNLIKNAFTYTKTGTVVIEADTSGFTVTDTGTGIPEHQLAHIFERGFKGESSQGHGLGLALVRRVCDYYRWQLEIDSTPEQGTSIKLKF
ncbi:MAG: sensor histidine kinase [Gammaproteobacteria bacterium]